jgi:hypothetical protein
MEMSRYQTTLSGFPARTDAPVQAKAEDGLALPLALNVAFTSERATAGALRYAAELADGLRARLQVIVPQVVPYGRDLNDPDVDPRFTAERALEAARCAGVDANVHVVLCRDRVDGLHDALGPEGIVMIGGRRSWWPLAERRLAQRLSDRGHKVLFVEGDESK